MCPAFSGSRGAEKAESRPAEGPRLDSGGLPRGGCCGLCRSARMGRGLKGGGGGLEVSSEMGFGLGVFGRATLSGDGWMNLGWWSDIIYKWEEGILVM